MRLDASYLHFISQQQLRVLTSIQLGMRNHQWVPVQVIARISRLRGGQAFKILRRLLKNKFVVHTGKNYDGYKLAYLGYDYLALQTFIKRGILKDVICKIGVGKQSDIYKCITPDGQHVVLKLTRLGRNSFRSVKKNRQYIQHRTNYNWLYLSRLSSIRQFLFMQLLHENKFQTPRPIDTNRHAIVMSLVDGEPLCHIQRIKSQQQIKYLFQQARQMLIQFAKNGLIHGDYNQFNLITNDLGTKLTVIDFPQCISIYHPNAQSYFNRDVQCIYTFFDKMVQRTESDQTQQTKEQGDMSKKRYILNVADYPMPVLGQIQVVRRLDHQIKTKGHISLIQQKQLQKAIVQAKQAFNKDVNNSNDDQEDNQQEDQQENQQENQQEKENQQQEFQNKSLKPLEKKQKNNINGQVPRKQSFQKIQNHLEQIEFKKENQQQQVEIYDKQLENLMKQLSHTNLKKQFNQNQLNPFMEQNYQSDEEQERPEFKGLTAFQIRQKIKLEKKLEREKRKKQMTQDQYIKNAVKRYSKKFVETNKIGNRGIKKKNKLNSQNIKQGLQMI